MYLQNTVILSPLYRGEPFKRTEQVIHTSFKSLVTVTGAAWRTVVNVSDALSYTVLIVWDVWFIRLVHAG